MKRKVFIGVALFLLIAQFIRIDKTNPPLDSSLDLFSLHAAEQDQMNLFKNACYDCHSNETAYPWYTNIAPVSWWIKGHINNGRAGLNFSEWGNYSKEDQKSLMEESAMRIKEKWMPLATYLIAHSEARITEDDRANMVEWLSQQN